MFKGIQSSQREIDLIAFLTGLFSLLLQVVATHFTFLASAQSSYAVGVSLFAFLSGLGLAARAAMHWQRPLLSHFRSVIGWIFAGVGIYFVLVTGMESVLRENLKGTGTVWLTSPEQVHIFTVSVLSAIYLFLPALFLGLVFPMINDRRAQLAEPLTGRTSSLDYLGAGLGCLIAAFYLIPWLGLERAAVIIGLLMTLTSMVWHRLQIRVALMPLLFGFLIWPGLTKKSEYQVLFSEPSPFGTVTVSQRNGEKSLAINLRGMCTSDANKSERLLGRIPLDAIPRNNLRALNIGLGCGFTAREIKQHHKVKEVTVIEINPVVVQANEYFALDLLRGNGAKTEILVEDGYQYLNRQTRPYDLIAVDIEEPTITHSSPLYTQEFFLLAKKHLSEDGIFSLWSFYQAETGKVILNTLRSVFPYAEVMLVKKHLVFVASKSPFNIRKYLERSRQARAKILSLPLTDIATLEQNPYLRYYHVNDIFRLPATYKDPFEMK